MVNAVSTRTKLLIALFVVIVILGVLIRTAIVHASTYYLTVHELQAKGPTAVGESMTVSGNIVGSSVKWDPSHSELSFIIQDDTGTATIPVKFHGAKPDSFSNNWPVIVTGSLSHGGQFVAQKLLVKCPSKYQASTTTTRSYSAT